MGCNIKQVYLTTVLLKYILDQWYTVDNADWFFVFFSELLVFNLFQYISGVQINFSAFGQIIKVQNSSCGY